MIDNDSIDEEKVVKARHEPLIPKIVAALPRADPEHESLQPLTFAPLDRKIATLNQLRKIQFRKCKHLRLLIHLPILLGCSFFYHAALVVMCYRHESGVYGADTP